MPDTLAQESKKLPARGGRPELEILRRMAWLRQKLEAKPQGPRRILTTRRETPRFLNAAGSAMECAGKAQRRRRFSQALKPSRQKRCRAALATALHILFLGFLRSGISLRFIPFYRDGLKPELQACL
jgi:hypothetical protein